MAKRESRKQRKEAVYALVMFPIVLIVLLLMVNGITNLYFLGGILVIGAMIGSFATRYVPDMRKKENKNKNEYTGLPSKRKSASTKKNEKTVTTKKKQLKPVIHNNLKCKSERDKEK